jgi:hypothetical protein
MSMPSMKPTSRPRTLASVTVAMFVTVTSQKGSMPATEVPTMLRAPIAKPNGMDTMATPTQAIALAAMTWPRCGTRVKVVSPLR